MKIAEIDDESMSVTRKGSLKHKHESMTLLPTRCSNIIKKATVEYTNVMKAINPSFRDDLVYIPRRTLTNPREPSKNNGYDNINDDYILRVKGILGDIVKYEILDLMGQGTFGQVVKCKTIKTGELVAVKVVKNQPIYSSHGDKEVEILCKLRDSPEHKERFLQLQNSFVFRGHKCAVFELLSISLHKFLQQKPGKPYLAIYDIQRIASNILETLDLLKDMRIIHTDLKPDNILLKSLDNLHNVKLIDYGSAFFETDRKSYCIQTAFYRSPEVILQMEFGCAIDMWSFGCFVAELFIGKPLFPSGNEAMLMHMMVNTLESSPPDHMLYQGKRSSQFFHFQQQQNNSETQTSQVRLRGLESSSHDIPVNCTTLEQAIMGFRSDNDDINSVINDEDRKNLYDFLKNILVFDPVKRFSPREALKHPFIMGTISRSSRPPIQQNIMNSADHATSTTAHHRPQQPASKSTGNLPLAAMYASLTKAASLSSTSRTTEDSQEIITPTGSSYSDQQIMDNQAKSKSAFNKNSIATNLSKVLSPPKALKSILKNSKSDHEVTQKSNRPISAQSISLSSPIPIIAQQPENTLDSKVAFLFQQSAASRPTSVGSNPSCTITSPITTAADTSSFNTKSLSSYEYTPHVYYYYPQQHYPYHVAPNLGSNSTLHATLLSPTTISNMSPYQQNLQPNFINPTITVTTTSQVGERKLYSPNRSNYSLPLEQHVIYYPTTLSPFMLPQQQLLQNQHYQGQRKQSFYQHSPMLTYPVGSNFFI